MVDFLPPVLMGEARQQQQVVLCWDTRTTQPYTPLVTGEGVGGCVCMGEEGHEGVLLHRNQPSPISTSLTHFKTYIGELLLMEGLVMWYIRY